MLLTFAYAMVNDYDSSIPGLGFSLKGYIDGGTINLVNLIGSDGSNTMLNEIKCCILQDRAGATEYDDVPVLRHRVLCGAIPFSAVGRDRVCNRGLRRNCGNNHRIARADLYSVPCLRQAGLVVLGMAQGVSWIQLYKVIAAATLNVLSHVLTNYYIPLGQSVSDPSTIVQTLPLLAYQDGRAPLHDD
jgi:hypothetical protein